jgi:LPXTG-site transpeptidase (sortase) family protein
VHQDASASRASGIGAPRQVRIPAIGVVAALVPLGLAPDRTLQAPPDFTVAGWFQPGPEPGEVGAAVIAGHVDSRTGPAVFFRLSALSPGDEVEVNGDHGVTRFRVDRVKEYSKAAFPTLEVYGPTPEPTLRLITCGGDFDRAAERYRDNIVVYASLAG